MSGKYQAYPEYKESGVEWVGDYPANWNLTRVKFESYVKGRVGWHGLKSDDFTDEGPYLVTGSDFKGPVIKWADCYHCDIDRYDQDPYIQLREGDLLITKDGTIGKVALVNGLDGKATLNSGVFVVRPFAENYTSKFYFWLLQSRVFTGFVDLNKTGSTIVHLYQDTFVNFRYAMPSFNEQLKIGVFLDHETAKIDTLIEKQQQLIKLLKEKRQAVISHAVTKGLNPNAPMRDSGVEWLGGVPEGWLAPKVRYVATLESGHTPSRNKPEYWENCYIPWISLGDVWQLRSGRQKYISETKESISDKGLANSAARLLPKNTVILSRTASVGFAGIMKDAMATTQDFANWVCGEKLDPEFLLYCFWAMRSEFDRLMVGSTHKTIYMPDIKELFIALPPINEQFLIVEMLNEKLPRFDALEEQANKTINLLQERRTALISAAVTGKIDVRHFNPEDGQTPEPSNKDSEAA